MRAFYKFSLFISSMIEMIFLFVLAFVWIIVATVQDLKTREITNWLNFSLIIFALGFRFFYVLFSGEGYGFFYQGLIGLGIFFIFGNLFYYGRMFAGGDAKLMIALGAVLPFYDNFSSNLKVFALFFALFLFAGAIYGLSISLVLSLRNFKDFRKEFFVQLKKNKKRIYFVMVLSLGLMVLGFVEKALFTLGIVLFVLPYFYIYAKAIDERCMVRKIKVSQLREGDWLYKELKIGKGKIKPSWGGLSKKEVVAIKKKYRAVFTKQGIAFSPAFLISFIILGILIFFNLTNFLWNAFW